MALDNANFIAELSITDPLGTDPLSQGDDQIRTIKRATFQSFPNIAAQVSLTDAQMNLAAIKNEANVFTAIQTIQDQRLVLDAVADIVTQVLFKRNSVDTWSIQQRADADNNNLRLRRFDALGLGLDSPWEVDHTTGIVDFASVPTVQGDPLWIPGEVKMLVQGATLPSNNWFPCNGTNGTVDLRDRILGAQGTFTGTQSPFLDAQTDVGPNTGNTGLSVAQMAAHTHRIWSGTQSGITDTTFGHAATETVAGANRGNTGPAYATDNAVGTQIIEDTGVGNTHAHTIPELEVNPAGGDAFQVMPFTYFMQAIQYVP